MLDLKSLTIGKQRLAKEATNDLHPIQDRIALAYTVVILEHLIHGTEARRDGGGEFSLAGETHTRYKN